MSGLLHHRFAADLEVRSGGDGRTVCGIACPFDAPTPISEWGVSYTEQFARGAFARSIGARPDRVKFLAMHDRGAFPLGRATVLREDTAGLYGEFRVSNTERGDEALELIRDGALDGFSVGFTPVRSTPEQPRGGDLVTRLEVRLSEVSAVSFPAYDGARIVGVRSEDADELLRALDALRDVSGVDLARLDAVMGWAVLAREGRTLSGESMTQLQAVLDLIAAADRAVDEAQPKLAALMGVPNPDADDDDAGASDEAAADGVVEDTPDQPREQVTITETREVSTRAAIPPHHTETVDDAWDAAANLDRIPTDAAASTLRDEYAWVHPAGDPATKAAYRFPHHDVASDGTVGAANVTACTAGIAALNGARGGTTIPDTDREGVWEHLAAHLKDAGHTAPVLRHVAAPYDYAERVARRHRIA